ncbi:ephexin isoform X3 [Choristoneura fumiferana]|uniref:ephexin isoform X3 n=1 Tax=Choristoneura fumiferana TaxID=7141 RepID=UPI003D158C90
MLLNGLMEGAPLTKNNLSSTIKHLNSDGKEHGTISALMNFILPDTNMAIKDNQKNSNEYVYTVPIQPPTNVTSISERMKSINAAKQAFLNSTVNSQIDAPRNYSKKEEVTLHYAQIAITTESEDSRSTGGGRDFKQTVNRFKGNENVMQNDVAQNIKKNIEHQQRKVSFKIKTAGNSHRRPPPAAKTMTFSSSKVSELTKKFNELVVNEPLKGLRKQNLVKTIEDLQATSRCSASNSSTPSSTLSSSPNLKIVLRQRRGSRKRNNRRRCSSMDSIDKHASDSSTRMRVIRSKSDGTKIPKSPKKRLKSQGSSEQSGSDSVDGSPKKSTLRDVVPSKEKVPTESNVVKNVIKKFECEISAQTNLSNNGTLKRPPAKPPKPLPIKEKPKVPEKKSTLVLTKNIVVKDGVPKIKTIRPVLPEPPPKPISVKTLAAENLKRRESLNDKHKYKTNYIHSDKMPLHIVEIIQEDINESSITPTNEHEVISSELSKSDKLEENAQDVNSSITPNESFLWRRKSSTQIYSDSEKSASDSPYSVYSCTLNETVEHRAEEPQTISVKPESQGSEVTISYKNDENKADLKNDTDLDFESNLVEAYNKEVLIGFTSKPKKVELEDDYEILEPRETENVVVIPIRTLERVSKINCPLPEIPKEEPKESKKMVVEENIYQCLLEMRSHPEGDESSLHSYELCDSQLEERTRGDGDSDDGYEYCKSPIKPYCVTSSTGIQIAENYQPYQNKPNHKNYQVSKSVSGTSTVSYEKIGSDRIYERIPAQSLQSKESSPTDRKRHSYASDYTSYNDTENIYDTIKLSDCNSHCYESIPNSPSVVKLRNSLRKQLASTVHKRLSFDTVSNISQSTMSSEQKTNSIYGQRSVMSYNGQEIAFQVPSSETSVSDRSDRSDDWVDVSDEEKNDEQKIIIVRERSRGRKSPISWSQKVRHQWQKTPKEAGDDQECDSGDSGHLYESLEPAPAPPRVPLEDDFDSFDSDTDSEDHEVQNQAPALPAARLPSPPTGAGAYTLTKIASVAHKKMRQLKRNFTKRCSVAMDGKPFTKLSTPKTNGTYDTSTEAMKSPIYANCERTETHAYSNIFFDTKPLKTETPVKNSGNFKEELKSVIGEKRLSSGDVPPPLPEKPPQEKPSTPTSDTKKDSGTLSRKTYFSFKSRFRRATSMAVDINSDVPSALKITNSTFYLTDSMDGDSGFSNCSDNGQGSVETLSPTAPARHHRDELKRLLPTLTRKDKAPRARTSWYAECGSDTSTHTSNTSWYAEAGLYQAGDVSSSSGASSGSHPASPLPHSLFTHEPLYQFYNAAKVESLCRDTGDSDSDAYDPNAGSGAPAGAAPARPTAMALVAPRGPARTLWCEVPEVLQSAVLSSLAPAQKRLQEAKFELLTSEASYLNSLNVLESHFIAHPAFRDPQVLPREDWEMLFSTILPVRKCSQLLMVELEKCWQENILLTGICELVRRHADLHFHTYVKYCSAQALMVRALQRLRDRPAFAAALRRLESHPACQSLSLHSFLMLPMQRVTRLPLLLDAVLRHLAEGDAERDGCMLALATLNHFVSQCNEGARNTERVEEMWRLCRAIEFPPSMRDPPNLGPACSRRDRRPVRWLVRSGEATQLVWKTDESKLTFGRKFHKTPLHLFLFNDLLVITKKKGENSHVAVDFCPRSLLEVCAGDAGGGGGGGAGGASAKHALLLTLLENHEGRTLEMMISCPSETDASRWSEALAPPTAEGAGEAVYAGWDCPQAVALYAYAPAQPDELPLSEGDVLNVTRKTSEGWYYGERTRDGEAGWFPGSYTAEVASAHARARNLRQRYRLLALSGTYLGQRKKT